MFALFAAALAASFQPSAETVPEPSVPENPPAPSAVLEPAAPWWERITVTVDDKGKQQSCRYQTSLSGKDPEACDQKMAASVSTSGKGHAGAYSKLTFERRFSPGGKLDDGQLQPGDTLLGRQVMFLTIGADGSIESCKVVATTGDARPDYDCEEAKKEQFRAQAGDGPAPRQAFMTVLAYGHMEQIA